MIEQIVVNIVLFLLGLLAGLSVKKGENNVNQ